jgi:hypothetical protein
MKRLIYLSYGICLFLLSCSNDGAKVIGEKNKGFKQEIQTTQFIEPQVDMASFDAGFEDESREQTSDGFANTYMFSNGTSNSVSYTTADITETNAVSVKKDQKSVKTQKKIIKNGSMRIKSNRFNESKKDFDKIIKSLNGYYENEELDKNEQRIQYDLIIRLPSKNFEQLVQGIESGKDEILFKKINSNDVTEEFLDIQTRLENKRKYLKRYNELLSKAKNVNEILSIEENIRQLMEEIESKEGRLKYLNDQVDLSTLHVILFKEYQPKLVQVHKDPFSSRAGNSLESGWNSIINFLLWTVSKWPMILLIAVIAWFARRRWKKRKEASK